MIELKAAGNYGDWSKEIPRELWEEIIVHAENPSLITTCKLFKEIIYDPAFTTKNLEVTYKDQFPFSKDLKKTRTLLIERLGLLLPKNTMDCFEKAANLHYFTFTKVLNEEYCTNLQIIFTKFISDQIMDKFIEEPSYKKKISLIHNGINENPDFCNVQILSITRSGLTLLPKELNLFSGLTEVNFNYNKITSLPDGFGKNWTRLEKIDLGSNKLTTLPKDFAENCKKLRQVNLFDNKIDSLPPGFGSQWKKLVMIRFGYNLVKLDENEFKEKTNKNVRIIQ